jgi:hypothetical protein
MKPDSVTSVKSEATVGQLIGALATDTGALVRQELHLAATELTETAGAAARNAGYVAAGGALLHIAILALQTGLKSLRNLDPIPRNTLSTLAPTVFDQREPLR